jgi:hypothetical protein
MDQTKHKAVMDALSELIRSQLEGDDRHRFASAHRLAVIGQKLMLEMAPRPEDISLDEDENMMGDDGFGIPIRRARRGVMIRGGDDQQQMVRETMAMIGPVFNGLQEQNGAKLREARARELNDLIGARALLSVGADRDETAKTKLTKRIDAILTEIAKEEGDEDGLRVVPAVDVRRHQAGPGERIIDKADTERPLAHGKAGDELALRARDAVRGAPDGVGVGG